MSDEDVPVILTAYPDGPLLIRGPHHLVDADGTEISTARRTVAVCRCGRSGQKPWCDSSHKLGRRTREAADPNVPTRTEEAPMTVTATTPTHPEHREPPLPSPRGPVTEMLVTALAGHPAELPTVATPAGDPLSDDDLHLALYLCYEIHYRGFAGVDPRWEWHPPLLALRGQLETAYEAALREQFFDDTCRGNTDVASGLRQIADRPGPSLSEYLRDKATAEQFIEVVIQRSAYRLKEADPHAFAIPRLEGKAKAALVEIEFDEFGSGRPDRIHAVLYRTSMDAMGLDGRYGAYLDAIPGVTLATVNAMSLFGLHRRLRGAAVGHLAIAEMTSALANKRQADGLRRLGYPSEATGFFDEHVIADSVHDLIALNDMARGLAAQEPGLTADILFGASAATGLDYAFARYVLDRWAAGESSLRVSTSLDP